MVKFARIYALKNNIVATNTLDRLQQLFERNILSSHTYQEVEQAYNYLMLMRFKHQANALSNNKEPDNYINPNKLTSIEKSMLKKIFSSISNFQTKLSFDFKGSI